MFIVYVQITRS